MSPASRTTAPNAMRAIVVLAAMIAAFAYSLGMVSREIGVASPWFGFLLMMCALGVFSLARPLYLPRMPWPLHTIASWERGKAAYRKLLVPAFGELLKRPPLRYLNPEVHLRRQRGDAASVEAQAEAAEAAHLWAGLVPLPYIALAAVDRRWIALVLLLAVEIVGNVYPMLHLRITRARLQAVLARRGALSDERR